MCKAPWGPSNLVGRCKSSKLSKLGSYTLWYAQFITKAKTGDHDDVDDNDDDDEDASLGRDDNVKQLPGGFSDMIFVTCITCSACVKLSALG